MSAANDETYSVVCLTEDAAREALIRCMSHAKALLQDRRTVLVSCGPALEPIGVKQRGFLHKGVLKQISEQARLPAPDGTLVRYTIAIWKEHYRARFLPDRWESRKVPRWDQELGRYIPGRARPVRVRQSSEELGVREYARFTNEIIDHAVVELGVEFHFTADEQGLLRHRPTTKEIHANDNDSGGGAG